MSQREAETTPGVSRDDMALCSVPHSARMVQQWDSGQQPLLVAQEAQGPPKLQTKLLSCRWFAQSHVPVSFV